MLLTLQDLLHLYCSILLLLILYVLFKICKAGRHREPEVIDQDDLALVRRPEGIRNRQRGLRWESENHSVRIRKNCATEHDECQGWYNFSFLQFILDSRGNSDGHKYACKISCLKQRSSKMGNISSFAGQRTGLFTYLVYQKHLPSPNLEI